MLCMFMPVLDNVRSNKNALYDIERLLCVDVTKNF